MHTFLKKILTVALASVFIHTLAAECCIEHEDHELDCASGLICTCSCHWVLDVRLKNNSAIDPVPCSRKSISLTNAAIPKSNFTAEIFHPPEYSA